MGRESHIRPFARLAASSHLPPTAPVAAPAASVATSDLHVLRLEAENASLRAELASLLAVATVPAAVAARYARAMQGLAVARGLTDAAAGSKQEALGSDASQLLLTQGEGQGLVGRQQSGNGEVPLNPPTALALGLQSSATGAGLGTLELDDADGWVAQ